MWAVTGAATAGNGLLALAALPAGSTFDGVLPWLLANFIMGIVSGLVGVLVGVAILRTRMKAIDEDMGDVKKDIRDLSKDVGALTVERTKCELRARDSFATRGELGQIMVHQSDQYNLLRELLDDGLRRVHERQNKLSEQVAAIGAAGKKGGAAK